MLPWSYACSSSFTETAGEDTYPNEAAAGRTQASCVGFSGKRSKCEPVHGRSHRKGVSRRPEGPRCDAVRPPARARPTRFLLTAPTASMGRLRFSTWKHRAVIRAAEAGQIKLEETGPRARARPSLDSWARDGPSHPRRGPTSEPTSSSNFLAVLFFLLRWSAFPVRILLPGSPRKADP